MAEPTMEGDYIVPNATWIDIANEWVAAKVEAFLTREHGWFAIEVCPFVLEPVLDCHGTVMGCDGLSWDCDGM